MNNFYIYKFNYQEKREGIDKTISATVIFCDREEINQENIKEEIRKFYEKNYQTDEIYVIGGEYLKDQLIDVFQTNQDKTFIGIPKRQDTFLNEHLYLLTFDKHGTLKCHDKKISKAFLAKYLNEGVQHIFINRGGLITAQGSHHFVFPSGKHCDRFLRTGNILLVSSEIYFIAFSLLKHFDETKHNQIYCDTSSINSVAFALTELKFRFLPAEDRKQIPIESFSSYDGLYKKEFTYGRDAFLIISASTSSNIILYILNNHKIINRDNIVIMYYLGEEKNYAHIKDQVLCNLTQTKQNPTGIEFYPTFKEDDCQHCKSGSYAVDVAGDVFLLENPKINKIIFKVTDAEKNLSEFVSQFKSKEKGDTVLKVNYKEGAADLKYEVYINYYEILDGLEAHKRYSVYKDKLNNHINQFIPSNTKYIVSLNDEASKKLSEYVLDKIGKNYNKRRKPEIIVQDKLMDVKNVEGTVVVVGSCISNGKNLLYISRALRKLDKLRIVYFIGISRTRNKEYLTFLKSNLKQGNYGAETNSFIEVDTIYCNSNSKNTSWLNEVKFLNDFTDFIRDESTSSIDTISYLQDRKKMLQESSGDKERGLVEKLFYPRMTANPFEELRIRKNFAFFNFEKYDSHVTQSDIYFTISNVINSLRNTEKNDRNLRQSVFVRNIIDPGNFSRFNDGIIQASILRAANPEELAYNIDSDLSQEMYNTFETLIKYHKEEQGEALVEFLYALATKKMTLKKIHLQKVVELVDKECKQDLFLCFSKYITKKLVEEKPLVYSVDVIEEQETIEIDVNNLNGESK